MMLLDLATGERLFSAPDGRGEPFVDESCTQPLPGRCSGRDYGPNRPAEPCSIDYDRARDKRRERAQLGRRRMRANGGGVTRVAYGGDNVFFAYKEL